MSQFTVSGTFEAREGPQAFERSIDAENEDVAREHVLSQFGAEHNLQRTNIEITEVQSTSSSRTESDDTEVTAA
ncbi:Ribosomal LX protein [halophilic archaeon DL31]|jgi:large subunit ribosomal protein LX|nr:Ribosomal LX protein [halophilic archaeon DL31]